MAPDRSESWPRFCRWASLIGNEFWPHPSVGQDQSMERVVDLDRAADEVAERRPGWSSRGLVVGPVTWRDESAPWPQRLETERSRVGDPDSIGVHFSGSGGAELVIVLFRGGWADVDFIATLDDAGVIPAPDVASVRGFGDLLDRCVARVFGSCEDADGRSSVGPSSAP